MTYPCPYCRTVADLSTGCPGCGRGPDRDAAEVIRLDAHIGVLTARLADLRRAEAAADEELHETWKLRHAAAARVRAAVSAAAPPPAPARPAIAAPAPRTREASTRLVQNALFVLGGLLLGVAAIVFTAVAWSQFGVGGRALLLAAFTAAALAAPLLALRRGLRATAETFAAVGLLLVLLDGYAAWYVNLFGVADYSAYGYAGAVCAVTAAVAAGYEHVTGLTGPRYAALLVAQPVLPLLVAPLHPDATGWSFTLTAVAVMNLAVIHLRRGALTGVGITAYVFVLLSIVGSGLSALLALVLASSATPAAAAGAALVTAALVLVATAVLAQIVAGQAVSAGLLVVALGLAAGRYVAFFGGESAPVLVAAVVAVLAFLAVAARRVLPAVVRRGPWAGAIVLIAVPGLVVLTGVAGAAVRTVEAAQPFFAAGPVHVERIGWQITAVVALLAAAAVALVPATWRHDAALGGAALLALTVPAGFALPWWSAPVLNLLVAAAALVQATLKPAFSGGLLWLCGIAAGLVSQAVLVGFGRPGVAALTLGTVALLGVATAALAWTRPRRNDVGGASLAVGLLAVPAAAWTTTAALSLSAVIQSRVTLVAAAAIVAVLHVVARRWPAYRSFAHVAALLGAVTAPLWAVASGDSPAVYAAAALLLIAATVPLGRERAAVAAVLPALALAVTAGAGVLGVLVAPYGWLGHIWAGRPAGVGLDPAALTSVASGDVAATALLAAAVALAAYLLRGRRAAIWSATPVVAVVVPMALTAGGVPWPAVPAASLLLGLAGLLTVALRPSLTSGTGGFGAAGAGTVVTGVSVALTGAGLAGSLPTRASTLAALGAVLVAGAVAGAVAPRLAARLTGWLAAITAAVASAVTAGSAAELSLSTIALLVLAVAAVTLVLGTALSGRPKAAPTVRRSEATGPAAAPTVPPAAPTVPPSEATGPAALAGARDEAVAASVEGRVVQVAAHATAVVALLLTVGSIRSAAAICTLWGVALGMRALWPGEQARVRHGLIVAAACAELGGWWLLIANERVAILEAYTLPAAAVAMLAGWLARRDRPGLTSWVGFGPALAAALLPTLASVLVGEGQPLRRLLLGLGALAVVLAGSHARLQAPVVIGGSVLAVVALHELVLVWDLLPRWIPLAAAGLLLVGLAMTLERRRRDLARFRAALTRMT